MTVIPAPQQAGALQFFVARAMSYSRRMLLVAGLILLGLVLQAALPLPIAFVGLAPMVGAGLLMLVAGFTNKPGGLRPGGFWKICDTAKLAEINELHKKSQRWDRSLLDISNPLGFFFFLVMIPLVVILVATSEELVRGHSRLALGTAACLLLPIWFSGWRMAFSNAALVEKTRIVQDLVAYFESLRQPGEVLQTSLNLSDPGEKAIPTDARFMIRWENASPEFYGVQCQVNVNVIQGRRYPYVYFVLVARRGLGIRALANNLGDRQTAIEPKQEGDVEIIVIRQATTRTSGYHTKPSHYKALMQLALQAGRQAARQFPRAAQ